MGDIAKWAILIAGIVIVIGLIMALPIIGYIDVSVYADGLATIISYAGDALIFARGFLNNFFSPWARKAVSGLMLWFVGKWLVTYSIKVMVWVYHYIFK